MSGLCGLISWGALAPAELAPDFRTFWAAACGAQQGIDIYDVAALREQALDASLHGHVYPYLYPPFRAGVRKTVNRLVLPELFPCAVA